MAIQVIDKTTGLKRDMTSPELLAVKETVAASLGMTLAQADALPGLVSGYGKAQAAFSAQLWAMLAGAYFGDVSGSLIVVGDSTGNEATEWVYRTASEVIAPLVPGARVQYCGWDDATQDYSAWTVIQAGASGERGLRFAGAGYASLPVSEMVSRSSGDIDVAIRLSLDSWATGTQQMPIAWIGSAGNRAWRVYLHTNNNLRFEWSADGTNLNVVESSAPLGFAAGATKWIRCTLDVDNGGGGYTVTMYTSDDAITWTQIRQVVTSAGTTSVYAATADYTIGAANGTGSINGTVYEVRIRDGISGPIINPQPIEAWFGQTSTLDGQATLVGSPTVYVVNGAMPGQGIDYFTNATRLPRMMVPHLGAMVMLSTSHNDPGYHHGRALYTAWDSWIADIKSRLPGAGITLLTQNPRNGAVATWAKDHAIRVRRLMMYAARNGLGCIDTYSMFKGADLSVVIEPSDGIHPTKPAGVDVQLRAVTRALSSMT